MFSTPEPAPEPDSLWIAVLIIVLLVAAFYFAPALPGSSLR